MTGAAACGALPAVAQTAGGRHIDVHRHVSPPFYQSEIKGVYPKLLPPPLAAWTPDSCLADMDAAGIGLGMLSMPAADVAAIMRQSALPLIGPSLRA